METTVKERLVEFIEKSNISIREFERKCNLSNGYIKSLRKSPTTDKMKSIIYAFPDLNQQWLLTGEGSMLNESRAREDNKEEAGIPLIPADAMAGMLGGDGMSFMEYECEHYLVPAFKGADFLIRVQGDSMMPKYLPGDIVACKKVVMDRLWFQWGKCYVADTRQGVLIKRVEPSREEGCIEMNSENQAYKPFDLPVSEVNGLALVVGVLRVE